MPIISISFLCLLFKWMKVCKSVLEKQEKDITQVHSLKVSHIKDGVGRLLEKTVYGKVRSGEPRGAQFSRNTRMLSQRADSKVSRLDAERNGSCITLKKGGNNTIVGR